MYQDARKNRVRDYAVALFSFLLISGLILWFARITVPMRTDVGNVTKSKIYSMCQSMEECQPNHRQLAKWLYVVDPSYIATPSAIDGPYKGDDWISSRQFLGLSLQKLPPRAIRFEVTSNYVFPFRNPTFAPSPPTLAEELLAGSEWPPPRTKATTTPGLYWYDTDMTPIPEAPTVPIDTFKQPSKTGTRVCKLTIVPSVNPKGMPRVKLKTRSGHQEFDHAVVKYGIRWLRKRAFEDKTFTPPREMVVIWIIDGGASKKDPNSTPEKSSRPKEPPRSIPKNKGT